MYIYDYIYEFYWMYVLRAGSYDSILDGEAFTLPGSVTFTYGMWLADILTIITLILLIVILFGFVRWLFRLFAGLIKG